MKYQSGHNKVWVSRDRRHILATSPRHITVSRAALSPYNKASLASASAAASSAAGLVSGSGFGARSSSQKYVIRYEDEDDDDSDARSVSSTNSDGSNGSGDSTSNVAALGAHDDDGDDDDGASTCPSLAPAPSSASVPSVLDTANSNNTQSIAAAPAEPAAAPAFCARQSVPSHAMFALSRLASLLQYVAPGALVALDIDDTLVKKRHYACSLLSPDGLRALQAHLQRSPAAAASGDGSADASQPQSQSQLSLADKQRLVSALYAHVKAFTLAEDDTAHVVRALQDRGVKVFGLTARSPSMAAATTASLAELGIDLARAAPASLPRRAVEPATGAAVVDGIVYCGYTMSNTSTSSSAGANSSSSSGSSAGVTGAALDKGVVFQRLLEHGWISWDNNYSNNNTDSAHGHSAHGQHPAADDGGRGCPDRTVWFVDDSLPMITGMVNSWVQMAHAQAQLYHSLGPHWAQQIPCRGKLALVCCHYTHPTAAATPTTPAAEVPALLRVQVARFVASGGRDVLSDADARRALYAQSVQMQAQSAVDWSGAAAGPEVEGECGYVSA